MRGSEDGPAPGDSSDSRASDARAAAIRWSAVRFRLTGSEVARTCLRSGEGCKGLGHWPIAIATAIAKDGDAGHVMRIREAAVHACR